MFHLLELICQLKIRGSPCTDIFEWVVWGFGYRSDAGLGSTDKRTEQGSPLTLLYSQRIARNISVDISSRSERGLATQRHGDRLMAKTWPLIPT